MADEILSADKALETAIPTESVLPTADEFFGAPTAELPTEDEFFAPGPLDRAWAAFGDLHKGAANEISAATGVGEPVPTGPAIDEFFHKTSVGRVMRSFGQGMEQGWGAGPVGLGPDTEQWLKEVGLFNDYEVGQKSFVKSFNESLIRPAVAGLEVVGMRLPGAVLGGLVQTTEKIPVVGPVISTGIEAVSDTGVQATMLSAGPLGALGALGSAWLARGRPVTLPEARSLGVIGEGESGWKGTRGLEDPKIAQQRMVDAYREWDDLVAEQPASAVGPHPGEITPGNPALAAADAAKPITDVHQVARQIAPQVFERYDALEQQADTFRRWIDELGQARAEQPKVKGLQTEIDGILGKVKGVEDRLTKTAAARLESARGELDSLMKTDTPDMARVRQELQKNDFARRDMAQDVSGAYRQAQEVMPPEVVNAPETTAVRAAEIPQESAIPVRNEPEITPIVTPEVSAGNLPPEPRSATADAAANPAPAVNIAEDVAKKIVAAGRPAEEAQAASQIIASHYEARAPRLGLTADELYREEAPDIRTGGRQTARELELAQKKPPEPSEKTLEQSKRGTATFRDGQATVRLFKDADASTVMHETGHVWLEELLKDAVDSRAVQSVRDDADAVRKWLGAEGQITTKQHEKFARGFERYLMEGRAPTKELASVFEQFKNWLTDIYQTVQKLRAPITDEIREVFDRLIAVEPREAVIADDMKRGPSFAEIHKADADTTPPARAAEAADRIREETAEITRQRLPEMYDELYPDGSFGRGPNEGQNLAGQGDAARSVAGSDGNAAAPGGIGPGGGQPAGEGAGARSAESAKPLPEPVTATDPIPRSETQLVDKAGNIRIDNLNVPDDVAAAIRQSADEGDGFVAARRGVMSDAQALELADSLGMTPDTLNLRKIGEAFNAEQIWAARKLLVESAIKVRDSMAKAAGGTDADVMAYAEMKARHQMIQEQVSGITAEAGRALRAFRAMEGMAEATEIGVFLEQSTGKTLFQLKREAQLGAQLDTPQKVSKFINDSKRAKFSDMVLEFWINALLSGPTTHVKNIVGNMTVAVNRVFETGVAGGFGLVRRAVGIGPESGVLLGESKAALFGILQGAKDGVKAGAKAFMNEEVLLKGNHSVEQRKYQAIPSAKINVMGRELEIGGRQVRIPGRFLGAQDEFFKAIAHRQELNTLAYREATEAGLTGDAFKQRVADIVTNPSDLQMEAAQKAAAYQTFTQSLGPTGRALQSLANSNPLLKVVIPFIRTPTNILKYAYERTPVAAINPWGDMGREIRANLSGANGGAAMDTQMARLAVGTMIGTAFMAMAIEGDVTGGGPSDPRERAMLKASGWQPYSLKIGESYYAYDWLDPFATIMGVSADMAETGERAVEEDPELGKVAAMLFGSISKNLMSKLSLRGASDLIEAVSDPDRYGEQYIRNMAGTVVPSVIGQAARAQDPVQREARDWMDQIKSRIPGLRETLFPSRNVWGEPITPEGAVGPDYGSPLRTSTISDDPVNERMVALKLWPAKPGRTIRGVELTEQQYDDYTRTAGRLAKMRLDAIVANPQFANAPDFVQRDIMDKMIDDSRESARTLIMAQNPAIIQAATEDKLRALRGEPDKKGPIKQLAAP